MLRSKLGIVIFGIALLLTGCLGSPSLQPPPHQSGTLALHTVLPAVVDESAVTLELLLTQNGQFRHYNVPLQDGEAYFAVDGLYEGFWDVTLQIVDDEGDIIYIAENTVVIHGEQATTTELKLVPAPGTLEVIIDLANWHDISEVQRARINVTPGGYTSGTREEGETTIRIARRLEPRTYDYNVALYGDNFNQGQLIYSSPWTPVTIRPGKVTTVLWSATTGSLELIGEVLSAPSHPTDFRATHLGNGRIQLSWNEPPDGQNVGGYRIYERQGPFAAFALVDEVPPYMFTWQTEVALEAQPLLRAYAVSAVSIDGLEGPRTEPIVLQLPPDTE